MKIHITNLYNFNAYDQMVIRQHRFANAGRNLGFHEMGIFSYPVATDSPGELSKRLDGIIAALEPGDAAIMQLPTQNGYKYEQLLFNKISSYRDTRIALLFHDMTMFSDTTSPAERENYMSLCKNADMVIVPSNADFARLQEAGILELLSLEDIQLADEIAAACHIESEISKDIDCNEYKLLCGNGFYINKFLLDVINRLLDKQKQREGVAFIDQEDMIQVGFGLHDKNGDYSVWVGTTMQSIIEHTKSKVCFHILLDDTVSEDNKNKLVEVATAGNQQIKFHYVDKTVFADIDNRMGRYTIGAMFRILLPEILTDIPNVIYLDADLLFNCDIKELWDMNIGDYSIIAAYDAEQGVGELAPVVVKKGEVAYNRYFNTGVLYMNLDKIRRKGNMREMVLDYFVNTPESLFPDQDALNALFNDDALILDITWNYRSQWVRRKKEKLDKKVYHYAAGALQLYSLTEMDQLYFETINHTPWGREMGKKILADSLGRMNDCISQLEDICVQLSGTKKIRVFYGEETNAMKNMYKILNVQEGDYRVLAEIKDNPDSILPCKELSILHEETNEHIIFVLPQSDNWMAVKNLIRMGYTERKDFFVIPKILDATRGGYV